MVFNISPETTDNSKRNEAYQRHKVIGLIYDALSMLSEKFFATDSAYYNVIMSNRDGIYQSNRIAGLGHDALFITSSILLAASKSSIIFPLISLFASPVPVSFLALSSSTLFASFITHYAITKGMKTISYLAAEYPKIFAYLTLGFIMNPANLLSVTYPLLLVGCILSEVAPAQFIYTLMTDCPGIFSCLLLGFLTNQMIPFAFTALAMAGGSMLLGNLPEQLLYAYVASPIINFTGGKINYVANKAAEYITKIPGYSYFDKLYQSISKPLNQTKQMVKNTLDFMFFDFPENNLQPEQREYNVEQREIQPTPKLQSSTSPKALPKKINLRYDNMASETINRQIYELSKKPLSMRQH